MKWHEFVFGGGRNKVKRHLLFWGVWYLYFMVGFFLVQQEWSFQNGLDALMPVILESIPLLLGHILVTYLILRAMRASFFETLKPFQFTGIFLVAVVGLTFFSYSLYRWAFPWLDLQLHHPAPSSSAFPWWSSITGGPLSALKVILASSAIQLSKRWYLKATENLKLQREKAEADLQLLKAQVQPGFLFQSLDHIYQVSRNSPEKAAGELLRLSELLSYMLYEADQEAVQLKREIAMVKTYIELERAAMGERLDIALSINGDTENKWIAPLLLMPFLENCLTYCKHFGLEKAWASIEMNSMANGFSMRLLNGKWEEHGKSQEENMELARARQRLSLLYPDRFELKIHSEPELMVTQFRIDGTPTPYKDRANQEQIYHN